MHFYCEKCRREYPMDTREYQCECGGLFRLFKRSDEPLAAGISLGEVRTPLLKLTIDRLDIFFKMEQCQPTGSFKDRGAFTLINELKKLGIASIVEDSAGNAGASIASYAAAAGMECTVYVPEDASKVKLDQIEAFGAKVKKIKGGRDRAAEAVRSALNKHYYASHVYNPLFFEGMKSLAYEIYEQLGNKVPEYIFLPVGNGTMLLGLYYGFEEIGRLPRLIAVQSKACQPLCQALQKKNIRSSGRTIAESIRVGHPPRIDVMIMAVKNSRGDAMAVTEAEICEAKDILGKKGIYTEVSSAAALAGARRFFQEGKPDNYRVVIPLTGSGLK